MAAVWRRAATKADLREAEGRTELAEIVAALCTALGHDASPARLAEAEMRAETVHRDSTAPSQDRLLALAMANMSRASAAAYGVTHSDGTGARSTETTEPDAGTDINGAPGDLEDDTASGSRLTRLAPTSRQAVQVALAASLAIVAGELLSPARWYWAVIAAFVIYSGTASRGQTLTKGWQRILGTVAGVVVGTFVASLVGGNVTVSIVLIFVSLFFGFYLMKVSYVFMVAGTTTMLALLYGLLGQFTVALLVTRVEETAIGAAIGILTAVFVLPIQHHRCWRHAGVRHRTGPAGRPGRRPTRRWTPRRSHPQGP